MPWSRNRNGERSLGQAINDLEALSAATFAAAEEARKIAAEALAKLTEIEQADHDDTTARRVRWLSLLCFLLIILAACFTYVGVKGFANPLAISTYSSVQVAVQSSGTSTPANRAFLPNLKVSIAAFIISDDRNSADYQVIVPSQYAGKRYVLLLEGAARIDAPDAMIAEPAFHSAPVTCEYPIPGIPTQTGPCQLITGTFPARANATMPAGSSCPSSSAYQLPGDAVEIDIAGSSHVAFSLDWAHEGYDLPSLYTQSVNQDVDRWNGISLGGQYRTGNPAGCLMVVPPIADELTDANPEPDHSTINLLTWNSVNAGVALVTRSRSAEEVSNAMLALGAATIALGIGFIPVAYDAYRTRKRSLNRRAGRGQT
jgi:hypothetical protein